jgi:hypothetical protein
MKPHSPVEPLQSPSTRTPLTPRYDVSDLLADPFCERSGQHLSLHKQILGGRFRFESNSHALLEVVEQAYAGLPPHHLPVAASEFRIELRLAPRLTVPDAGEPPPVRMQSGAGLLCGAMDAFNYVVLAPEQQRALIVASEDMLERAYYLRYELIEFAVFTLATRGLGLVPLHGACIGSHGRGVLLLGSSGSGKSTLALHSLLQGLDFVAEDAVFVHPPSMLATGVANYVHVKSDAFGFLDDPGIRRWIGQAPVIRRRSGVEKYEADVRDGHGRLAAAPLKLVGAICVTPEFADDPDDLLHAMPLDEAMAWLSNDQPYAAGQPQWPAFQQRLLSQGIHRLQRGRHPSASVAALRRLLARDA